MTSKSPLAPGDALVLDPIPLPRRLPFDAPWAWLAAGWRDIWTIPSVSLLYGGCFALAAAGLILGLFSANAQSLFLVFAGGFLLIGPFAAVGLYEASRKLAQGERVKLADALTAGFAARGQLAFFGALLLFMFMIWLQLAFLLLMLFLSTSAPPQPSAFLQTLLFTPSGLGLLIVGSIAGGIIAVCVFAISAAAVPMLLVRHTDAISAARASIAAVTRNPQPMALWAGLIVVIMAAGFATLLVGLVLAFPLIGHATWHAYADLFGTAEDRKR